MTDPTPTHEITVTYTFTYERTIRYPSVEDRDCNYTLAQRLDLESDEFGSASDIVTAALQGGAGALDITVTERPVGGADNG